MKKTLLAIVALAYMAAFAVETAHAQLQLNAVIQNSATELSAAFERGYGVAVLAMHSDSAQMSDHIINEMIVAFMTMQHARGITVVNRLQLNAFAAQHGFDTASLIDDATAQSLGTLMNVRYVVTGAFEPHASVFRLSVRVMDVQTASTRSTHTDVQVDGLVASLMGIADRPIQVAETRTPREPRRPQEPWEPRGGSLGFGPVFNAASGSTDRAEVSHRSFGGWFFTGARFFEFSLGVLGGSVNALGDGWRSGGWDWSPPVEPPPDDNGDWWDDDFSPYGNVIWQSDSGRESVGMEGYPIFTLNMGFNWRIPFDVHDRITVFPILGLGLEVVIATGLIEPWGFFDSLAFTSMRLNFGGGADFELTERMFIRVQLMGYYGLFFGGLLFPQDSHNFPNMFGLTPRIGIGFRR